MISTDFASNEAWNDALFSLRLLFQPWRWRKGTSFDRVRYYLHRRFFSKKNAIFFFLTGRSAIYYYLHSLQLPKNSEVIVQGFTCEAVILPILELKHHPVYVDIETQTYSMDPTKLEAKITEKTKVIILQYSFGITPHREQILAIAAKHNIEVLEDMAHGFNPTLFKNDSSKTTKLLSFGRSKAFSSVFGGALVTSDKKLIAQLSKVEKTLVKCSYFSIAKLLLYKPIMMLSKSTYTFFIGKIIHKIATILHILTPEISKIEKSGVFDHNSAAAYPNALSLLLHHQLQKYESTVEKRILSTHEYISQLSTHAEHLKDQPLIRFPLIVENRNKLLSQAKKKHIYLGKWYDQVVAPKALNLRKIKYAKGTCPVAEDICEKMVNLPTNLSRKETHEVITLVKSFQESIK